MTFEMQDTTGGSIDSLSRGLKAYASYVDNYGGYPELVRKRGGPGVTCLSITIFGNRARCADFESGALSAGQAGGLLDHVLEPNPVLYTFASNAQNVVANAGNRKYQLWVAHTGQGPHICGPAGHKYTSNPGCQYPAADATQWVFSPGGVNIDVSVCADDFLHTGPPPPPPDPHGYLRFTNDNYDSPFGKIRERDVVEHYDGARKHPVIYKHLLDHDLRPKLHWLCDRIFALAHSQPDCVGQGQQQVCTPSWDKFDRGWRYQQLRHRADGARLA
jgi:hypothetical protein